MFEEKGRGLDAQAHPVAARLGGQEKETNFFIFDQIYFPQHKGIMMIVANNT